MPSASVTSAIDVNAGLFNNSRDACRRSRIKFPILPPSHRAVRRGSCTQMQKPLADSLLVINLRLGNRIINEMKVREEAGLKLCEVWEIRGGLRRRND